MISPVYMDEMLRSVVFLFCAKTSDSTRPRMTMPVHTSVTSLESAKTILCALTGQFAHQTFLKFKHVYDNFGQRVQRIIMASRTPQLFDAVLQEILILIPQHQITSIPRMQNRLLLTADTLAMPRSHIHGSPRRFYCRLNLTDDPGNANFRSPIQMHYMRIILLLRMITDAIRKPTDQ